MRNLAIRRDLVRTKLADGVQTAGKTLSSSSVPLFSGLTSSQVSDVLARGRVVNVEPKVRLCSSEQIADRLFLLTKGRVKYYRETRSGEEILLRLLTPFDCFGIGTLLPHPLHYLGTAEAVFATEVVIWDHAEAIRIADSCPEIRTNALRITLRFLGFLSDRHSSLFDGQASHRIAHALIDVGRRSGGVRPEGIDVHITNEQLGSLADVSRFTASRVLSDWSKKGVISKKRETVLIHSAEALLADSNTNAHI